jgi:pyrroloquinoline quinone biosynthesis protein D
VWLRNVGEVVELMSESAHAASVRGLGLEFVPRVHVDATVNRVGGQWMAATAGPGLHGTLHTFEGPDGVSEVGERIVALIDGKRTVGEIVDVLLEEFEVSRQVAEADTLEFVTLLVRKQVLDPG